MNPLIFLNLLHYIPVATSIARKCEISIIWTCTGQDILIMLWFQVRTTLKCRLVRTTGSALVFFTQKVLASQISPILTFICGCLKKAWKSVHALLVCCNKMSLRCIRSCWWNCGWIFTNHFRITKLWRQRRGQKNRRENWLYNLKGERAWQNLASSEVLVIFDVYSFLSTCKIQYCLPYYIAF